jgi:hypothetical protein
MEPQTQQNAIIALLIVLIISVLSVGVLLLRILPESMEQNASMVKSTMSDQTESETMTDEITTPPKEETGEETNMVVKESRSESFAIGGGEYISFMYPLALMQKNLTVTPDPYSADGPDMVRFKASNDTSEEYLNIDVNLDGMGGVFAGTSVELQSTLVNGKLVVGAVTERTHGSDGVLPTVLDANKNKSVNYFIPEFTSPQGNKISISYTASVESAQAEARFRSVLASLSFGNTPNK